MEDKNNKHQEMDTKSKDYFMGIAQLTGSLQSDDPKLKVGACIVDEKTKTVLGIGYNRFPTGLEHYSWEKEGELDKHCYVIHAEKSALLNKNSADIRGAAMFVTLSPCSHCASFIIQSGIKKVYYLSLPPSKQAKPEFQVSKKMFEDGGVQYTQYIPSSNITINFSTVEKSKEKSTEKQ